MAEKNMSPVPNTRYFRQVQKFQPARNFFALRAAVTRFARLAVDRYYGDMLSLRAMSLTYSTLLSIVPLLAVMFSVLKAFGIQTKMGPLLSQALAPLGAERYEITRRIVEFVDNTQVGVLGAIGVVGLLYTVVSLVGNVENSLNDIWKARRPTSWTHRYREYLSILLLGPVLLFAGFAVMASAQSYWLVQRLLEFETFGSVIALLTHLTPFILLCTGFAFLYKYVPAAPVRLRSAIFGAAVAGALWQLSGVAFAAFVASSVRYEIIYSGFAILVVFLIWLYVAWLIVLIGAETAYLHQHARVFLRQLPEKMDTAAFQEQLALSALVEITRRFLSGKPPLQDSDLSARLGVPLSNVIDLLEKFVGHGILLRCSEPEGIALGRDPQNISAVEILSIIRDEVSGEALETAGDSVARVLYQRDLAVRQGLENVTLRSLASDAPDRRGTADRDPVAVQKSF
jgi:membrane protein